MNARRQWKGRGQDFRRVGGVLVSTDAQRAALRLMAMTLGAALSRSSRIEQILGMLVTEVAAGAKEIDGFSVLPEVRAAGAQLDVLEDSPIAGGYDFALVVVRRLAERVGCAEAVNQTLRRKHLNLELHHIVDRARGAAMEALTGEAQ